MKEFNNIRDLYDSLKKEMEDKGAIDYIVIRDINTLKLTLDVAFEDWIGIPKAFEELILEKYKVLNGYRFVLFSTRASFLGVRAEVNRILMKNSFNKNQMIFNNIEEVYEFCEKLEDEGEISNYLFCYNGKELEKAINVINDSLKGENQDSIKIRSLVVDGKIVCVVSCEYVGMDYIYEIVKGEE